MGHKASGVQVQLESSAAKQHAKSVMENWPTRP